ncbi:MAG: hypothetical protein KJO23_05535 [Bacteroidia bacterium]|nr:hypothetical protein [Bacteroidia bacterium]NNM23289.1 hypothetical protein [Flavobacteriaceae bacterium]
MNIDFIKLNKMAIYGGLIAMCISGLGAFLLGNISGYEAKQLIGASLDGINMLCNTIVLASATILALLLTLLGISTGTKTKLKDEHYAQVLKIAKFDTILFISALLMFQFFNLPIMEADNVPTAWFKYVYWASLFASSLISGMMVAIVLLLYGTITNIIKIVGLGKDHPLLSDEEAEE